MNYGFTPATLGGAKEYGWRRVSSKDKVRISVGNLTFDTCFTAPPKSGISVVATDLEGWWEPAPDESRTVASPTGDGVLAISHRKGARSIALSGFLYAASNAGYLIEQVLNEMSALASATVRVDERKLGLYREADVRNLGLRVSRVNPLYVTFTLSLQADDPLRYGTGERDLKNGRNVLLNAGDAVAWPLVEVRGPTTNLQITHDGGVFKYADLSSSQTRLFDCRNGAVLVKGSGARRYQWEGAFPSVPVGGAEWTVSGLGSGAKATVRRFEAWT